MAESQSTAWPFPRWLAWLSFSFGTFGLGYADGVWQARLNPFERPASVVVSAIPFLLLGAIILVTRKVCKSDG